MAIVVDVGQHIVNRIPNVDKMKLYKLCFYSQAWHLAWAGAPLFREIMEAWVWGPVTPALRRATEPVIGEANTVPEVPTGNPARLSDYERAVVDSIVDFYGRIPSIELSGMTHEAEAWKEARRGLGMESRSNEPISLTTLRDEFTRLLDSDENQPAAPASVRDVDMDVLLTATESVDQDWWEILRILADR